MMATIRDIYVKYTKISGSELDKLLKHDLWWKSDKCIEQGLVDKIWTKDCEE